MATSIEALVPDYGPKPIGDGEYDGDGEHVYFYVMEFHPMDEHAPMRPVEVMFSIIALHKRGFGASPNGIFGSPVARTVAMIPYPAPLYKSWVRVYTHIMKQAIQYDNEANGPWPEYDAACQQVLDIVVPRLLGVLNITPTLIHGDLWEANVGFDFETSKRIIYDPFGLWAHNEAEFGTWRGTWSTDFARPEFMQLYQEEIKPSEPVEEWDDRNRLYSLRPNINASAGHPGTSTRAM